MARSEERERMVGLLKQWRASGESGAAFCRRHGIKPQKLSYWKRVLGARASARPRGRGRRTSGLVPIHLLSEVGGVGGTALEIQLAGGERIVFPQGGSAAVLREGDRLKVLVWDQSGFWVLYKRLEQGTFAWPGAEETEPVEMRGADLMLLLSGVDMAATRRRRWYERAA